MPALAELQARFVAAVLHRQEAGADQWLAPAPLTAGQRLGIYRVTARENFALALEAAYPLLRRRLGPDEFRRLAWAYQQAHPSPAGNVFHSGRALPGYLQQCLAGSRDEYLADVARLEWACQQSLVAADAPAALDLAALAAVPAGDQARLVFHLHPSAGLVATRWPVFEAWQALQSGTPDPDPPAAPATEHLLVYRAGSGLVLHRLPAREHAWLRAVGEGTCLGRLAELPGADASSRWLPAWAARGVIAGFGLAHPGGATAP